MRLLLKRLMGWLLVAISHEWTICIEAAFPGGGKHGDVSAQLGMNSARFPESMRLPVGLMPPDRAGTLADRKAHANRDLAKEEQTLLLAACAALDSPYSTQRLAACEVLTALQHVDSLPVLEKVVSRFTDAVDVRIGACGALAAIASERSLPLLFKASEDPRVARAALSYAAALLGTSLRSPLLTHAEKYYVPCVPAYRDHVPLVRSMAGLRSISQPWGPIHYNQRLTESFASYRVSLEKRWSQFQDTEKDLEFDTSRWHPGVRAQATLPAPNPRQFVVAQGLFDPGYPYHSHDEYSALTVFDQVTWNYNRSAPVAGYPPYDAYAKQFVPVIQPLPGMVTPRREFEYPLNLQRKPVEWQALRTQQLAKDMQLLPTTGFWGLDAPSAVLMKHSHRDLGTEAAALELAEKEFASAFSFERWEALHVIAFLRHSHSLPVLKQVLSDHFEAVDLRCEACRALACIADESVPDLLLLAAEDPRVAGVALSTLSGILQEPIKPEYEEQHWIAFTPPVPSYTATTLPTEYDQLQPGLPPEFNVFNFVAQDTRQWYQAWSKELKHTLEAQRAQGGPLEFSRGMRAKFDSAAKLWPETHVPLALYPAWRTVEQTMAKQSSGGGYGPALQPKGATANRRS